MKPHQPGQLIQDASVALAMLKEGNQRYLEGYTLAKDYTTDRETLETGQHPFAVVLTCADSRVVPEIFFDQKLGDLFIIRNAGNVADKTALGSMEYAIEHLQTPLIVVCGHSKCGAVTAACEGGELPPNIKSITDRIQPACKMGGDVDTVIHNNVLVMVDRIRSDDVLKRHGVTVVGAYYDLHTGEVTWL